MMIEKLFTSATRIVLLSEFLLNPERELYLRQICSRHALAPRSVSLELANLESIGLITRRPAGKAIFYVANRNHILFPELQRIFIKTVGLADIVRNALEPFTVNISLAFIYGSFAKGDFSAGSDIDLMIIGQVSSFLLSETLGKAGQQLGREINYAVFSEQEIKERLADNDHFLKNVSENPKMFLIGTEDEFNRLAE
jgi:predicted nucleotidyltransferase